ncbi:MAG: type I 3-dehydroquinate dehydratase [Candidatus Methanomethylophilus sp.]|jgi:3-dehydroquinate dehydratase/shikimate dehydrogenase|nr:type I 3-dehydroquinate dehydratase [Methanomethylophilus sp.]MCI2093888.1 type I 3-dehydroquinate dehydratase [Methanomethylophilus sp.]
MRVCAAYGSVPDRKAEADLHEVRLDIFRGMPPWLGDDCIITLAGHSVSEVPEGFRGLVDAGDSDAEIPFRRIRSVHDFSGTPSAEALASSLNEGTQEVSKYACAVHSFTDLHTIYLASEKVSRLHVLLGMGETGTVTRIRSSVLGNLFTFGYVGNPTAPGQLSAERMRELGDGCEVLGIAGHPLGHSRSPAMQEAAMRSAGISGIYLRFDSPDTEHLADVMREYRIRGMNVTVPHKVAAMSQADSLEGPAREIGAVNTLANRDGRILGANTDWEGVVHAFRKAGRELGSCSKVLVFGTGGAARAGIYAAMSQGCSVSVLGRNPEHVSAICRDLGAEPATAGAVKGCDALIQCTQIGMKEDGDYMFGLSDIRPGTAVMDMVYNRKTALVSAAEKNGCTVVSGTDMLVGQGAASFRRWFGKDADIRAMERAAQ